MPGNPADDLKNASPASKSIGKLTHDLYVDMGYTEKEAQAAAATDSTYFTWILGGFGHLIAIVITIAAPLILFFLEALTKIRTVCGDQMAQIGGGVLSEFLGTDVVIPTIKDKQGSATNKDVSQALGTALYTQLLTEFGPGQPLKPGDGERAAKIFSGYAINFAVQNALISTLVDAGSVHLLGEFRELGVEVAKNLGLGRLQRMALGTLLQQVIQKPYQRDLASKYRPDRMSVSELIHAYHRGNFDKTYVEGELAQMGYRNEDIPLLIQEYQDKLSITELERLVRFNAITQDVATAYLVTQGVDQDTAVLRFQSAWQGRQDTHIDSYVSEMLSLVKTGYMDIPTLTDRLVEVPWTDEEKAWALKEVTVVHDHKAHQLTWTQVITAFEQGIVDVSYVEDWLTQKNYSDEDIINMELLLAVKFDAFVTAAKAKADALAKKNAPKPPPTPPAG